MEKKYVVILLVVLFSVTLVACSSGNVKAEEYLTDGDKELLNTSYSDLSSAQIERIEEMEKNIDKYDGEDQELISKNKKRLDEEKIVFDKEESKNFILSDKERETFLKEYINLTAKEKLILEEIKDDLDEYSEMDKKIIAENTERLDKEKLEFEKEEEKKKESDEKTSEDESKEEKPKEETPKKEEAKEEKNPAKSSGASVSQENALRAAENYINIMPFSKSGLIEQLEFEGYSTEDATFGVEGISVDWNKQAAKAAENYLDMMAFSRSGLIEQLKFEGFTDEQASYGANQVGL